MKFLCRKILHFLVIVYFLKLAVAGGLADEAHTPASSDSAARGEIIGTDEKGDKVEAAPVSNNTVDSPSDKDTQQEEKRQEIRPGTSDGQKDPRNAVNHGGKQNVPSDANKAVEMDDKGKRDTAAVAAVREAGDEGAGTKDDDAVNGVEKRNVQNGANELVETKNKGNQGAAAGEQADDENTEHQNDAGSQKNPPESNKPVNVKEDTKDAADQKEAAAADKDTDEQEDPRDDNADQQKSPEDDKKNDVEKHKDEKTEDEHEDKGAAGRAETKESQGVEKEKANDDDNVDKDDDNEGGDGGNDDETETNKNRAPGAGIDEKGLKDTAAGAQVAKPGPDNTFASTKDQVAESIPLSSSSAAKTHVDVKTSSHFMPYFITITVIVVMLYVVYHKRNLVFALLIEGRRGSGSRRRGNSGSGSEYQQLSTAEEGLSGTDSGKSEGKGFAY